MSDHRLFVVVSTGQNVANLPPVLEHAKEGDHVLWIESAAARKNRWSQGASEVLQKYGLRLLDPIHVDQVNDPSQVVPACESAVQTWRDRGVLTFLVTNGGNKLTPLGLLQAWNDLRPVVLYGDDRPAVCWTFTGGMDRRPVIRPYERHTLDLEDILAVTGHLIQNRAEAHRFWPGPLANDLHSERYGCDADYTRGLHAQHYEWAATEPVAQPVRYADLAHLLPPARLDRWKRSLPPLAGPQDRNLSNEGLFENIYHATIKLAQDAALARSRGSRTAPSAPIGPSLERAVARRMHAWLESVRHPAVQSVWRSVKVARRDQPERIAVEFDILLVLKNGILWHLECKAATADLKDLDARLLNLQLTGSQLATMALCLPLLTACATEPWFAPLHELRQRMEPLRRLPFVPFTLPGQPDTYSWSEPDGTAVVCKCPTLEQRLEETLAVYRP